MVQVGPDTTTDGQTGSPSAYPSGYGHSDTLLRGISPTHVSGAGCRTFGDAPFLPFVGALPADPGTATVPIDTDSARAGPGWYAARLGNGVSVDLAADERSGMARLRFPEGAPATVLVKASGSLAGTERSAIRLRSPSEVAVTVDSGGFCGRSNSYRVHVVLRFDRPAQRTGFWGSPTDDGRGAAGGRGDSVGAWPRFDRRTVKVQVGVSFVSRAGARRNLDAADLGWSVSRLRERATGRWQTELGRISVDGGDAEEKRTFTTALYHAMLHPMLLSDADGRYPGFDGRVHRLSGGRRHYTTVSGWDVYRTQMPMLAWLRPDVASDVVRSLHRAAREGGRYPRWPIVAEDTEVMEGDSAAPVIASAHAFGAHDVPLRAVARGLVRQALDARPYGEDYARLGYVPTRTPDTPGAAHGASMTLEYAVDDFAVSRLARLVGDGSIAESLHRRSRSWANLLDAERRVLAPRAADGSLPGTDWTPSRGTGFEEGNAAQYTWSVPHDMAGLLRRLGETAEVVARLDEFHTRLNAGSGSPHAWLGNQPSFATPWAYLWLGRPARTQDVVARARAELFSTTPGGLPGNDDLGAVSA